MGEIEQYVSKSNNENIYINEFNLDYSELDKVVHDVLQHYAVHSDSRCTSFKSDVGVAPNFILIDSDTDDDDELPALIAIDSDTYDYHAVHSRCTSFKSDVGVVPDFILIDSDTNDDVNNDHVPQRVYGDNHALLSDSRCTSFKTDDGEIDITSFNQNSDKVNKRFPWYFVHQNNVHNYEHVTRLTEAVKDLSKSIEGRLQRIDEDNIGTPLVTSHNRVSHNQYDH